MEFKITDGQKAKIKKIIKGAMIASTGAGSLFVLDAVSKIEFTNTATAALVAFLVPTLTNIVKEFMSKAK